MYKKHIDSAFPHDRFKICDDAGNIIADTGFSTGMTMLDWFAGMALQGLLSNSHTKVVNAFARSPEIADVQFAESAYCFAAAMIEHKKQLEGKKTP